MKKGECINCNLLSIIHAKGLCFKCYRTISWKPKLIICKHCNKERYHKAKGMCASCHVKVFHYQGIKNAGYRKYHNISIELYREMTQACQVCGFNKVVDLHHLDHNRSNNSKTNLIGLCPNHHKMLHDYRFSEEVAKILISKGYNPKISRL